MGENRAGEQTAQTWKNVGRPGVDDDGEVKSPSEKSYGETFVSDWKQLSALVSRETLFPSRLGDMGHCHVKMQFA